MTDKIYKRPQQFNSSHAESLGKGNDLEVIVMPVCFNFNPFVTRRQKNMQFTWELTFNGLTRQCRGRKDKNPPVL